MNADVTGTFVFLSTPSARRATVAFAVRAARLVFLSTPSARRATERQVCGDASVRNFYPRPPRGGRLHGRHSDIGQRCISIHALREEGDLLNLNTARKKNDFYPRPPRGGRHRDMPRLEGEDAISIHALREEGDFVAFAVRAARLVFLSTPSARRATLLPRHPPQWGCYFYPRPPRGGRLFPAICAVDGPIFLSTPSARRATCINGRDAL